MNDRWRDRATGPDHSQGENTDDQASPGPPLDIHADRDAYVAGRDQVFVMWEPGEMSTPPPGT